jgi:hypothetical protein
MPLSVARAFQSGVDLEAMPMVSYLVDLPDDLDPLGASADCMLRTTLPLLPPVPQEDRETS